MARTILNFLVVLVAILGGFYQLYLRPTLAKFGLGRIVENIGNKDACIAVPELSACESALLVSVFSLKFFFTHMCSRNRSSPTNGARILGMLYSTKSRPLDSHNGAAECDRRISYRLRRDL
jgi:hypothetical protein